MRLCGDAILPCGWVLHRPPRMSCRFVRRHGVAHLSNLAVVPAARREGIGRQLLEAGEAVAVDWGCRSVALHVDPSNTPAFQVEDGDAGWLGSLLPCCRGMGGTHCMLKGNAGTGQYCTCGEVQGVPGTVNAAWHQLSSAPRAPTSTPPIGPHASPHPRLLTQMYQQSGYRVVAKQPLWQQLLEGRSTALVLMMRRLPSAKGASLA